jgi:hypothetical protein
MAVVAVLAIGGIVAIVHYGATALRVSGGFESSTAAAAAGRATWANVWLTNRSGTPITLHAATARRAAGAEILDTRVVPFGRSAYIQVTEPLPADVRAALEESRPVEGFVLPPHSKDRYLIGVRFRPRSVGGQARLDRIAVTYSVFGIDQGAVSDATYCARAAGSRTCR